MSNFIDILSPFMEGSYSDQELDSYDFYRWLFPKGSFEDRGIYEYETVDDSGDSHKEYRYNGIVVVVTDRKKKVFRRVWDPRQKTYVEDHDHPVEKTIVYRYTVTDDLDVLGELEASPHFCLMSPLSYIGKQRSAENARMCYAITIDLDMMKEQHGFPVGLSNLLEQMNLGPNESAYALPQCSAIVLSGTGVHVYYILEEPVPLFGNIAGELQKLKRALTDRIWNDEVVDISDRRQIQQEGIYQGFRVVGTVTKVGTRARAFRTGEKISIEELNKYVAPQDRAQLGYRPKSGRSWEAAAKAWPEWAERIKEKDRINDEIEETYLKLNREKSEDKKEKLSKKLSELQTKLNELDRRSVWPVNRNVYEWWKREIRRGAVYGHRYWCVAMLAVYARKASYYEGDSTVKYVDEKGREKQKIKKGKNRNPVTYEELETDAYNLIPFLNGVSPENEFTEDDVLAALEYWDEGWTFYPKDYIEYHTAIRIVPKIKRNHRSRERQLRIAREDKADMKERGEPFRAPEGRPPGSSRQKKEILQYKNLHPGARPKDCIRDTGISKNTVYRWWKEKE